MVLMRDYNIFIFTGFLFLSYSMVTWDFESGLNHFIAPDFLRLLAFFRIELASS